MNRYQHGHLCKFHSIPHTRGDEPRMGMESNNGILSIPHTRGDEPFDFTANGGSYHVFPTHVGMNRQSQ